MTGAVPTGSRRLAAQFAGANRRRGVRSHLGTSANGHYGARLGLGGRLQTGVVGSPFALAPGVFLHCPPIFAALSYATGMERGVVVRGRLRGRHIELDEGVDELDGEVEVFVRAVGSTPRPPDVLEVIASLPLGTRSKGDIDNQLAEDRAGWSGRG